MAARKKADADSNSPERTSARTRLSCCGSAVNTARAFRCAMIVTIIRCTSLWQRFKADARVSTPSSSTGHWVERFPEAPVESQREPDGRRRRTTHSAASNAPSSQAGARAVAAAGKRRPPRHHQSEPTPEPASGSRRSRCIGAPASAVIGPASGGAAPASCGAPASTIDPPSAVPASPAIPASGTGEPASRVTPPSEGHADRAHAGRDTIGAGLNDSAVGGAVSGLGRGSGSSSPRTGGSRRRRRSRSSPRSTRARGRSRCGRPPACRATSSPTHWSCSRRRR